MPPVNILGISAFYHDSAACLVRDGEIIAAVQEERFTRVKHDPGFPVNAINYCLAEGKCDGESLDLVVFHEKPFLRFERILETYLAYAPTGFRQFLQAIPSWLKEKLWIKEALSKRLVYEGRILFPSHHESHAAAAFFPSPFDEAAILTMDGVGEWATASYGVGEGNRIELSGQLRFPHSLGMLYSAITYFTGFAVNSDEYKVMGLAPYGEPVYRDLILTELMDLREDGSFRLNMDYFNYCVGLTMTSKKLEKLLGTPPRTPDSEIRQVDMDLARSVQEVTETVILTMARFVRGETGKKNLVLSGGVALNSVANGKLQRSGIFRDIWIQPAAGDAGSALGAALYGWHQYLGNDRVVDGKSDRMKGALLGPAFSDEDINKILDKAGARYRLLSEPELLKTVSKRLSEGKVVGWFQGRMEFGPRALGARSILADARRGEMQHKINTKIKFREGFRPFGPAVLKNRANDYFRMSADSPYMLMVYPLGEDHLRQLDETESALEGMSKLHVARSDIPAVTHVDNSARIQTVDYETAPLFARLLETFESETGCSLLVNTSFNIRGEPIVCSPADAYLCLMGTDMDALAIGLYLLDKAEQKPLTKDLASALAKPEDDLTQRNKQMRVFGLSTGFGFVFLSLAAKWRFSVDLWWVFTVVGSGLAVAGLWIPFSLVSFHRNWSRIVSRIARWVSALALLAGYYGVLVPTALFTRLTGRTPVDKRADVTRVTYWEPYAPQGAVSSERQH